MTNDQRNAKFGGPVPNRLLIGAQGASRLMPVAGC